KFEAIPWVYGEIVRHLHVSEEVRILIHGPRVERAAHAVLGKLPLDRDRVSFWRVPTDRVWTRDYGPTFVTSGPESPCGLIHWGFNAWAKYPNWKRDADVPRRLA